MWCEYTPSDSEECYWLVIDQWKSDPSDKIKWGFFQAVAVCILLYECTTWTQTKLLKKKLDGIPPRMLQAVLNESKKQHLTKQQLYSHHPPISQTIQVRQTKHAWTLLEKKDQTHKRCSFMNSYLWTWLCWLTT